MVNVAESSLLENGGHAADGATKKRGCHIRWSRITKVVDVKESSGGLLRGSIAGGKAPPPSSSRAGQKGGDVDGNDSKTDGGKDAGPAASTTKVILCEVSGEAKAGQVMALMGPSGSGKVSYVCRMKYV